MTTRAVHLLLPWLFPLTLATAQLQWTQLGTSGAPMAYGGYAFDSFRNVVVAFGGEQGTAQTDVTREFNPTTSQWSIINAATRPSARRRPAMAFDELRGETVLFGGGAGTGFLNDTWTWNGSVWTQQFPAHVPPVRFGAAMAYDSARQVAVLFGGFVPSGQDIADLWEWDGVDWTQRTFANGPTARGAHRMVYDPVRAVTVLYGGYRTPPMVTVADTWLWNGTTWTQGASGPGSLCDQLFVWDSYRRRVVLFGGLRIQGTLTDLNATWEWDGSAWTQRTTTATPTARSSMACAFVPGAPARILCAGGAQNTGTQFGSTFSLQPVTPATALAYGSGCATTVGVPQLAALSLPYVGVDFVQLFYGAPAPSVGGIAFGLSNTWWNGLPLPLNLTAIGAPGCTALVSADVLLADLLVFGSGTFTWTLPNNPVLVGLPFFTQGLVFDPMLATPLQLGLSSARQFTIGAP